LIGDNCDDVYQYGSVERISPEAPVPIFKYSHSEVRPGMAANVKENLERLGCEVTFLSNNKSVKTRLIDIKSRQHIVRIDEDAQCDPIDILSDIFVLNHLYDAVVFSDYNKGTVTYELIEQFKEDYSGPIFIDTKKEIVGRFEGCFVKINELEFSRLKTQCKDLIVTLGSQGARYLNKKFDAPKVEVVDVTGAGDTFLSALTYKYLCENDIEEAIKFAIRASSITVQHFGVYAPSLDEI
jgi:D-beta-D-heptose 7-phosphate kinase/D-beta-D-heptose 1-phosphate adenosyltransferase